MWKDTASPERRKEIEAGLLRLADLYGLTEERVEELSRVAGVEADAELDRLEEAGETEMSPRAEDLLKVSQGFATMLVLMRRRR